MSVVGKKSKEEKAFERVKKRAGHWQTLLTGHGLSYFDELVVAYRTLPPNGAADDPWARAAAKAGQAARQAAESLAVALQDAQNADAAVAATPANPALKVAATAKAQFAAAAKLKLAEDVKAAALAQGAVESKLAAAQIITELIQKKERGQAIWSDILLFESALLRMMWFEPLKGKLLSLRQEYSEVMGAAAASALAAGYLDLKELTEEKDFLRMQAEAVNLMGELHWQYLSAPCSEWQKTELSIALGTYTVLLVALIIVCSLRSGLTESSGAGGELSAFQWIGSLRFNCSTLSLVLLAGAMGAALSAFQRIQKGNAPGAALLNLRGAPWQSLSVGVAPVIGALCALLLTLIFAGGILSGSFFPKVTLRSEDCATNPAVALNGVSVPSADTNPPAPVAARPVLPLAGVPTNTNLLRLTNLVTQANTNVGTNSVINGPVSTNTGTLTNAPADPRAWRDCQTLCRHRWCVAAGADLALLIIWAFIAGFSERLVPDMLSRLAKRAEGKA